jgi:hypothetical protein
MEENTSAALDEDTVLTAGGWDQRFTHVLATAVDGWAGAALIDPNEADKTSGREEIEGYVWEPAQGWSSNGISGSAGNRGFSTPGIVYACGQLREEDHVVLIRGEHRRVPVQRDGWWLFAARRESTEVDAIDLV